MSSALLRVRSKGVAKETVQQKGLGQVEESQVQNGNRRGDESDKLRCSP